MKGLQQLEGKGGSTTGLNKSALLAVPSAPPRVQALESSLLITKT